MGGTESLQAGVPHREAETVACGEDLPEPRAIVLVEDDGEVAVLRRLATSQDDVIAIADVECAKPVADHAGDPGLPARRDRCAPRRFSQADGRRAGVGS